MLIEKPACTFIGKITGGKTGDRDGLLDYLLCRWRKAQFEPLRFVFPFGRCEFLGRGWHDDSLQIYVRQNNVRDKSDGARPPKWRSPPQNSRVIIALRRVIRPVFAESSITLALGPIGAGAGGSGVLVRFPLPAKGQRMGVEPQLARGARRIDLELAPPCGFIPAAVNLTLDGRKALKTLLAANKRLNTAYVLKESFGQLWSYEREGWARRFFENWRASLKWQRLKPYEKFAEMIDRHWDGIAAYCRLENKVSLGFVEGLNNKIRVIQRRAYGLRNEDYLRLKILTCMLPAL